jgi:serine/threonine protein kinase
MISLVHSLRHPLICPLRGVIFEERDELASVDGQAHLLFDLCEATVADFLAQRRVYSEDEARCIVHQTLSALNYLHNVKNIVHRDLKQSNLLLYVDNDPTAVLLCDFDLAHRFEAGRPQQLSAACGSPAYMAPELLAAKPYGKPADLWSLGVLTFALFTNALPFWPTATVDRASLLRTIHSPRSLDNAFAQARRNNIGMSAAARDCIASLLAIDPLRRADVQSALAHRWIKSNSCLNHNHHH